MDYAEATEYIRGIEKYGSVLGLDNMRRLTAELGNVENTLNIIHIAGTNGKGSCGAFIDAILRDAGYSVCRYVSPAVFEYREHFQYNGENITEDELAAVISRVRRAADNICPHPTVFEVETAAAFLYCTDKKCDYAILETGMGGRYDAVNIISKSKMSVITSIGMDHTAFLGDTIEKIAYEKAGIIKENGSVVSAVQIKAAADVIEDVCIEKHARLTVADKLSNIRQNVFDYDDMRDVKISLNGAFQPYNAAAAIEVCTELGISEEHIRCGLANTKWRGRFETICENPLIIADGAHNPAAAAALADTIRENFGGKRLNFIMGVLKDKEYNKIAALTAPLADMIYTVTPDNARALNAKSLADAVRVYNKNVEATDIKTAVKKCAADKERVTIAFGSLSYLGDLTKAVENEKV
ncbi:MAG: bifunctional folylpolyglutamate synthase/dihydrofolate synthase [Firmicutes bacterium]|nr:bifunctional folylpolyglutamate synthase/dihydrofolate synthase [Bacillota bacterium]